MRYIGSFILLLVFVIILPCYGEGEIRPYSVISIYLLDSYVFSGLCYEQYAGILGYGIGFGLFPVGLELFFEPGAFLHIYLGNIKNTLYLPLDGSVLLSIADTGMIINVNTGIGIHSIFGSQDNLRFAVEIGPRLVINQEGALGLFPHFKAAFGFIIKKL